MPRLTPEQVKGVQTRVRASLLVNHSRKSIEVRVGSATAGQISDATLGSPWSTTLTQGAFLSGGSIAVR